MQANPVDLMSNDQVGGAWNSFPYAYSEYGAPGSDWITSLTTELDSAPTTGYEAEVQQKDHFAPLLGGGMHRISPLDSPVEVAEADSTDHKYPITMPYHHHHHHHHHQAAGHGAPVYQHHHQHHQHHQQRPQSQPGMKMPPNGVRYVPHGYYPPNGRTTGSTSGPMLPQPSLYPSPPGQVFSGEETGYNKPYGLLYMHGDHPPSSGIAAYPGQTEAAVGSSPFGPHLGNDLYQPYSGVPYEESASAFTGVVPSVLESSMPAQKFDAWNVESSSMQPMISPMVHPTLNHGHAVAIKQEYMPQAYISPSPSSMAGGSSIKAELMSDTSQSPPPGTILQATVPTPTESSPSPQHLEATFGMDDAVKPKSVGLNTTAAAANRKPARITNNYGAQYVCTECSRTFARQCGLTQHMKWHHSGEKPFRCFTCGKCFAAQKALDGHLERHLTTDKPYRCHECPKAFFHKNDLRRHIYQHTGMAPHACRYCSKTFARKDHCHSHEFSHERKIQRKERKAKGRCQGTSIVNSTSLGAMSPKIDDKLQ